MVIWQTVAFTGDTCLSRLCLALCLTSVPVVSKHDVSKHGVLWARPCAAAYCLHPPHVASTHGRRLEPERTRTGSTAAGSPRGFDHLRQLVQGRAAAEGLRD